jgi:hypothetical protein
MMTAATY